VRFIIAILNTLLLSGTSGTEYINKEKEIITQGFFLFQMLFQIENSSGTVKSSGTVGRWCW
jgi:hypothetical protein